MKKIILSVAITLVASNVTYADEIAVEKKPYNMALKMGTLGLGVEISTPIDEKLAMRFSVNGAKYSRAEVIDDVDYDGDLKLSNIGVLLDYYPNESTFRLTGGAYINNSSFTGTAKPAGLTTVNINGRDYGVDDIGQLDTEVTFNKLSPYVGLGWGNKASDKGWSFSFDIGAMYHGTPKADLDVTINNPLVEASIRKDVEAEKAQLIDDISSFKIYPVMMIGASYSF